MDSTSDDAPAAEVPNNALAIVGAAVHAPGARSVAELWAHLLAGNVLSEPVDDDALARAGVAERLRRHPRYVKRTLRLPGLAEFEPEFFGLTPRDAALLDPQLRHLYECTWEALEDAAIDPARPSGPVGLFVGTGTSEYLLHNLLSHRELVDAQSLDRLLQLGNDRDYVASRIAYALDLRGPCVGVAAACASGSLAVHSACQSLLGRECRVALAGAASIQLPHGLGYLFEEGGLGSPDGVCRAFDEKAEGTLPSSACAVVALMRLDDAVAEGRTIYATILATAFNNDGRRKVGYTAPSVEGPLGAIEEALAVANLDARAIGYVEAHGTGTPFGDTIEVSALTQAFRAHTADVGYCVLGANKPNLGHTDAASGVLSLIKAALCLRTRMLPPLVNFRAPHPLLELPRSPFRVVTETQPWHSDTARHALVNCLSIGGTNVHIVLGEPPPPAASSRVPDAAPQLLLCSARTTEALIALQRRLAERLVEQPALSLADVAHTLRRGRRLFEVRKALVVSSRADAIEQLRGEQAPRMSAAPGVVRLVALALRFQSEPDFDPAHELADEPGRFVALPSYPFERRAFWTEPAAQAVAHLPAVASASDHVPHARIRYEERRLSRQDPSAGQRFLVFVDETGFGRRVVAQLRALGCEVITARMASGPALQRISASDYRIDCDRGLEGPSSLIATLGHEQRAPDVILHLWGVTTEERFRSATNRFHHDEERGYLALVAICQGIAQLTTARAIRVVAATNYALGAGAQRVHFPAKALLLGPIATLPIEQPHVTALAIDLNLPIGVKRALSLPQLLERQHDQLARALLREAVARPSGVYALRGAALYARTIEPIDAQEQEPRAVELAGSGAYVIVGGFGNLGYGIARELASRAPRKLVLIGRTPIPERSYWDDWLAANDACNPVSQRIHQVRALEAEGADVLALSGDVCHFDSMSSALARARKHFGALHGLIHAAGELREAPTATQTQEEARSAIAVEVLGTRVLDALLRRDPLEFFVMLGMATRWSPWPGAHARIAASEFANGLCDAVDSRRVGLQPALYDLGLIRDGGMYTRWLHEREREGPLDDATRMFVDELERGMSTEHACRAVVDALSTRERVLVIGSIPLPTSTLARSAERSQRSELKRSFVAPEGELEQKLAALWAELLEIDRVGATDDFFELGGHSLIAVRLGARVKATWGVSVSLALLVEAATVRALAERLAAHLAQRGEPDNSQSLREWSTIVPLQPRGEGPPLFCVGGKGGNVMNLRHLAMLLGRTQPVFGLQARGVDGVHKPHDSLEAQIDEYIADILRVRASGPFLLAGFSGGGAMILEVARKLRATGHVVGPLLFLDAWNPAAPDRTLHEKVAAHAGLLRELGPRYVALYAQRLASKHAEHVVRELLPGVAARWWEPVAADHGEVATAWESAAAQYVPAPYPGDAVLFRVRADRTRGELDPSDDEYNGWSQVVRGGLSVIEVPGTHTSIVEEPHVRTLAASLRSAIDRALRQLSPDGAARPEPSAGTKTAPHQRA